MARAPLQLVDYRDVVERIDARLARATPDSLDEKAWRKLHEIVSSLASSDTSELVASQSWWISHIVISGFRGASPRLNGPLKITLEPAAGLTVFHGANGSGKSTVAGALRAALDPGYEVKTVSAHPKIAEDPWEGSDIHLDAAVAEVVVTLCADAGDVLAITTTIDDKNTISRVVRSAGNSPGKGFPSWWEQAYQLHQPIFAYADEYRKIKSMRDLRNYLMGHLLLGGALGKIADYVGKDRALASAAERENAEAWAGLTATFAQIAETYPAAADAPSLGYPAPEESASDWLTAAGMQDPPSQQEIPHVTLEQITQLIAAISDARVAVTDYRNAAREVEWGAIKDALRALRTQSDAAAELPTGVCPVCDTTIDWSSQLDRRLAKLDELEEPGRRANQALGRLRGAPLETLKTICRLLDIEDPARPDQSFADELNAAFGDYEPVLFAAAQDPRLARLLESWGGLVDDPTLGELAQRLVVHAGELQEWHRLRRAAAHKFADAFWKNRNNALSKPLWDKINDHLATLRKEFEAERAANFLALVDGVCSSLLDDAGLTLATLGITPKAAVPSFARPSSDGRDLPLGALSSGQHNAFLLAPVVGDRSAEPFGFVVFDDPVHALDDLRIDELASHLRERAKTHQVIVFTHDDRLTEYLRNATHNATFLRVERDAARSTISVTPDQPLWEQLLETCNAVLNPVERTGTVGPGEVRALLRQAMDAALRSALLEHVLQQDEAAVATHLRQLDDQPTTRLRFDRLRHEYANSDLAERVEASLAIVDSDIDVWNRASHRDDPVPLSDARDEVRRARRACRQLLPSGAADER